MEAERRNCDFVAWPILQAEVGSVVNGDKEEQQLVLQLITAEHFALRTQLVTRVGETANQRV